MKTLIANNTAHACCNAGRNHWLAKQTIGGFLGASALAMPMLQTSWCHQVYDLWAGAVPSALGSIKSLFRNFRRLLSGIFSRAGADGARPGRKIGRITDVTVELGSPGAIAFHQNLKEQEYLHMPAEKDQYNAAAQDNDRRQHEKNLTAAHHTIEQLQRDGRLSPNQIAGLAEFMAMLSAGDMPAEKTMHAFLEEFHHGSTPAHAGGDRAGKGWVN